LLPTEGYSFTPEQAEEMRRHRARAEIERALAADEAAEAKKLAEARKSSDRAFRNLALAQLMR
jgi:hypothetical protein